MTQNISETLGGDRTAKGVLFIGDGHISPFKLYANLVPVPINVSLKQKGIENRTVRIIRPPTTKYDESELAPPDCSWRISSDETPAFAFLPDATSRFIVSRPSRTWDYLRLSQDRRKENRAHYWDDHDAVLYFPRPLK